MRRAAAPNDAIPKTDGNDAFTLRARRKRAAQPVGVAPKQQRSLSLFFLGFMALLVLADLIYLYNLSSQTLGSKNDSYKDEKQNADNSPTNVTALHHSMFQQKPPREDLELMQENEEDEDISEHDTNTNDKQPIFEILKQAGIDALKDLDQETMDALPSWSQVQRLFGDKPRIYGLDRCQEFRDSTDPTIRFFGIAGTFNTGTNLLSELMIQNCQITERMLAHGNESKGMRWQVPWGKHYPASRRGAHATDTDKAVPYTNSLPLVAIRDPYTWMQSMCRHEYAAYWKHTKDHCPNLVPTKQDLEHFPQEQRQPLVPVDVKYSKEFAMSHNSLAHFWSDWYQLYFNATFPRIIVRFEDLLFYGQEVTETLCSCGGGVPREDRPPGFRRVSESAKLGMGSHGKHKTDLVGALIKYGNQDHRIDRMTPDDLSMAEQLLDYTLMETFGYSHPN
jgi:hypothetical protein